MRYNISARGDKMKKFRIQWLTKDGKARKVIGLAENADEAYGKYAPHDGSFVGIKELAMVDKKVKATDVFFDNVIEEYVGRCPVCNERLIHFMDECPACKQAVKWINCDEAV